MPTLAFNHTDTHKLLWTGGWDSTFQLLRLLLDGQSTVTPIYLIDTKRRSLAKELQTMESIKGRLFEVYPETQERLLPTQMHMISDIPPQPEITAAFREIRQHHHLGSQYEWLARYCHYADLTLQLGVEVGGSAETLLRNRLDSSSNTLSGPVLNVEDPGDALTRIFRYFSFPLIKMTKKEMEIYIQEKGWQDIMHMTWFCLNPTRSMKPCGVCNPCKLARKEGFGWRIPITSRLYAPFYQYTIGPIGVKVKHILRKQGLIH